MICKTDMCYNTKEICNINWIGIYVNQCGNIYSCNNFEAAFEGEVVPSGGALQQKIHSFSGKALAFLDYSMKKK